MAIRRPGLTVREAEAFKVTDGPRSELAAGEGIALSKAISWVEPYAAERGTKTVQVFSPDGWEIHTVWTDGDGITHVHNGPRAAI